MTIPNILALDFDGVLCDGMREYFEASRRCYAAVWPDDRQPEAAMFPLFRRLRPVIMTGWEMPLLLRALVEGQAVEDIERDWERVREALLEADSRGRKALASLLTHHLDAVRRQWIADDKQGWVALNVPYGSVGEIQRLVREPECTVLVTTKEGEFAREILEHWGVRLADIQGKEAGTHKCDNLRRLIADYVGVHGRRPCLWFVEDRLETLQHVTTHPDLDDVGLFLAAWGYNTPEARASVRQDGRIQLLELDGFRSGLSSWMGCR